MPYIVLGSSLHLYLVRGHLLVIPSRNKIGGLSGRVFFVSCQGEFFFVSCPGEVFVVSCPGVVFFVSCLEVFISVRKPFFSRPHQTVVIALT